ncbi:enoyl-CoA delta isomerase 2, peroxisomal-like [Anneissia japonica]|uniref:enoyl-CoA delta isomerase 2, peroxisomal-like n=1 Tax=Anneissia japonica TaxID=1529436 RepID=UPI001425647E|nr:enoyl-CoA delta isomerase 2, peroxisomal-like [Anneissia japonica]
MLSQSDVNKCFSITFENDFAILRMNYGENRFNKCSCNAILNCLDSVLRNPKAKALIAIGNTKYFSNGLDLEWMSKAPSEDVLGAIQLYQEILHRISHFPMPTVAAVNGHAFAGGALLAFAFDYRVMRRDRGWLCLPEIDLKLRFQPFMIQLAKLRLRSNKSIREVILFGKRLTGPQCLEADIVDAITEVDDLLPASKIIAEKCIGGRTLDRDMVRVMKEDIYADMQSKTQGASNDEGRIKELQSKHSKL